MRLSCSRSNEIIIRKHLDWIGSLAKQNPEDVIRNHPQIAFQLQKGYDLSYKDNISNKMWKQVLLDFLTSTLVGSHKDLIQIFSPLTDFSSTHFAIDNYQLHSVLGIGSNACVYKTVDGYCLKVVGYSRKDKLKKEYDILKNLQHPGIVNCFDYICDANYAAILMEELNPLLGIEQSYIQALNYCHAQGFLHGDIRLNNLGTDTSGNGKLFDFGNASAIKSQQEKQREIELLKNIMRSPVAQERKVSCRGDVLC